MYYPPFMPPWPPYYTPTPPIGGGAVDTKTMIENLQTFQKWQEEEEEKRKKKEDASKKKEPPKKRTFTVLEAFGLMTIASVFLGPLYSYVMLAFLKGYVEMLQSAIK